MDLGISDKLALVVGATGNTGLAVAKALAEEGCVVVAVARAGRLAAAEAFARRTYAADLMEQGQLDDLIASIGRELGAPEIIVHVIGGSGGIRDPLLPASEWAKVWRLNLGISHDINRAFLPAMTSRGWGRIVHFSSNGVKLAVGNSPYTSAKGAVESYVRTMAKTYAPHGVVISAVAPGPVFTDGPAQPFIYRQDEAWTKSFFDSYMPMKRWGRGEELGGAVALLCSRQASYMAGAIVEVDGGMR